MLIQQEQHQIIMENELVKINPPKKKFKTIIRGHEDGKFQWLKKKVTTRKMDFAKVFIFDDFTIRDTSHTPKIYFS
jgi:hypothetical protein